MVGEAALDIRAYSYKLIIDAVPRNMPESTDAVWFSVAICVCKNMYTEYGRCRRLYWIPVKNSNNELVLRVSVFLYLRYMGKRRFLF